MKKNHDRRNSFSTCRNDCTNLHTSKDAQIFVNEYQDYVKRDDDCNEGKSVGSTGKKLSFKHMKAGQFDIAKKLLSKGFVGSDDCLERFRIKGGDFLEKCKEKKQAMANSAYGGVYRNNGSDSARLIGVSAYLSSTQKFMKNIEEKVVRKNIRNLK